ncbi:hypothetical protein EUX98_g6048 [Antrodiella citrinella]|uniref:F-box domain-containing protein n=1 Tax=Antrodiella citrinella TaxID=2447956 RepID=A0A4S4MXK2_9APHY|nr:hypothetical protein EUX98_g6048 [Antrodiella citrinella]
MIAVNPFGQGSPGSLKESNLLAFIPQRIVFAILNKLSLRDLLRCKQTCRFLCRLVEGFPSLQYTIELAAAGMDDNSRSKMSPTTKLTLLRKYQATWSELDWTTLSGYCTQTYNDGYWEFTCGILSQVVEDKSLCFVRPSASMANVLPVISWTLHFDMKFISHFVDPYQDLLLIIVNQDETPHAIIRSLSAGGAHPRAQIPALTLQGPPGSSDEFHVYGDTLGLLSNWNVSGWSGSIFTLWNWCTGDVILSYDSVIHSDTQFESEGIVRRDFTNFTFLDDKHIALSACLIDDEQLASAALIQVIDISKGAEAFSSAINFYLPSLSDKANISMLGMARNATPPETTTHDLKHYPFCRTNDDSAVIFVIMETKNRTCEDYECIPLFIQTGGLLRAYTAASASNIPWEDWGPDSSRWMRDLYVKDLKMCTFGSKHVWANVGFLVVADFNPLGELANEVFPNGKSDGVNGSVEMKPSSADLWSLSSPLVTKLPYRMFSTQLWVGDETSAVYFSEDTVMINDDHEQFHIFLSL